jgi:iron complex transport system substrate-binding protein
MIETLGALVGCPDKARALVDRLRERVEAVRAGIPDGTTRPRVYFEEWDEPMISGIRWVSELIEIAGGVDVFADRSRASDARGRIVTADDVIAAAPDVIVGSWCGKKFVPERVCARPGFESIPAVRAGALHEIKSPMILQPGPAALTDGLDQLRMVLFR